jgi:signal transduction histidine kinase
MQQYQVSTVVDLSGSAALPELDRPPQTDLDFAMLVQQSADGLLVVDEDGVILFCNPAAALLLGFSLEHVIDSTIPFTVTEETTEVEVHTPDGGRRVVEVDGTRSQWRGRNVTLVAVHDVSDHWRTVATLEAALEEQRVGVAAAAHELRSPLAAILLIADRLHNTWEESGLEASRSLVSRISSQAQYLATVVRDLQVMWRLDAPARLPREELDLLAILQNGLAGRRDLELGPIVDCSEAASIYGNAKEAWLMISSCLDNAFRYGAPPVEIRVKVVAGFTEIRIIDAGAGVPEGFVPQLFEPFARAHNDSHGLAGGGLGLTIVRSLARSWGGDCFYEPSGRGATFLIRLPSTPPAY